MASRKRGQKDSGQYTVYNPPTSNLDLLRTRGDKYETRPHPTGQRWGDKVRQDYENRQQMDKTPPVTTSTDAMDTEEGDAITRMILDKTKIKARRMKKKRRRREEEIKIGQGMGHGIRRCPETFVCTFA